LAAREPHCIIFRGEIAHQRGHSKPLPKQSQRFLEKGCLPRTWARHQTDDKNTCIMKSLAKRVGYHIVLL
jgi:hypothetical protein